MSENDSESNLVTRRSFFQFALAGTIALPILLKSAKTFAADICPASPPAGKSAAQVGVGMAKTLNYVQDAKSSKHAKYKAGADCANCKFYNVAKAEGGYAPCTMMGMKYVAGCGWCMSHANKA